jgi:hypothetical protein
MKPSLLHAVAAPSPSVLSFLRAQVKNAFDSPAARCAGLMHVRDEQWRSLGFNKSKIGLRNQRYDEGTTER